MKDRVLHGFLAAGGAVFGFVDWLVEHPRVEEEESLDSGSVDYGCL